MNHANATAAGSAAAGESCEPVNEALLRTEIGFWRELIDSCDGTQAPESIERMHQALALAEHKLCILFAAHRAKTGGDANVFYLERP